MKSELGQTPARVQASTQSVRDHVCGMTVDPQHAAGSFENEGQTYFFCSNGCLEKFRADPERFSKASAATSVPIARSPNIQTAKTEYTCPMHPQIVRDRPGNCPICGMALEPRTVSLEDEENPELVDMTRRFWIGVVLTAPLLLIAMSDYLPGRPLERVITMQTAGWIELLLATPVVLWGGWPFFVR